jgi:raffinose/stachyose/melibiose transport system permease protein
MKKYQKRLLGIGSIFILLIHLVPFYILITSSFKSTDDLSSKWSLPDYLYLENFVNAWNEASLGNAFINNIIITAVSIIFVVIIGSLAAYPLARHQTKWNKFMYMLFISMLIVPPLAILVPLYRFFVDMHALNTLWGIMFIHVTFNLPITIFLYTGFIGTIPKELDEAGMIDGSSRMGLFFRLIMPLLKPVTATVVILAGVAIWNDYQFSVFFLEKTEVRTITVALSKFFGQYSSNIGWVAAGSLMGAMPLIVVYLSLQKQFIHGLSSGAVKG